MHRLGWSIALLALCAGFGWAQSPDPQPDKDGVYFDGFGIKKPAILHAAPALYSGDAQVAALRHVCALSVVLGPDGTPTSIQVENAHPSPLDDSAIAAVKQSTFSPGALQDRPVPVRTEVWFQFQGDGNPATLLTTFKQFDNSPVPLRYIEAEFTAAAREARVEGKDFVNLLVDERGMPMDLHLVTHLPAGLDDQALKVVRKCRFKPATKNGEPVPVRITMMVNFKLFLKD